MADDGRIRIEVGFDGGQVLSLLVEEASAKALEEALEQGKDGSLTLEAEDGSYSVALRMVAYLKRFTRESRVGFS
jgi:hypothetical protein